MSWRSHLNMYEQEPKGHKGRANKDFCFAEKGASKSFGKGSWIVAA